LKKYQEIAICALACIAVMTCAADARPQELENGGAAIPGDPTGGVFEPYGGSIISGASIKHAGPDGTDGVLIDHGYLGLCETPINPESMTPLTRRPFGPPILLHWRFVLEATDKVEKLRCR
jgi:hypothetical protein